MYINAVAGSVILYSQHDFYNIIFKIKHKLYIASGSDPPPQEKILGAQLALIDTGLYPDVIKNKQTNFVF
jgi:hypothetical protein